LNPAAGMRDLKGTLDCTGGASECEGHRWFTCIIEQNKDSVETYMKNMACLEGREGSDTWQSRLEYCFPDPAAITQLRKCKTERSTQLLKDAMAVSAVKDAGWMPYIIVDEMVLGDAKTGISLTMLKHAICKQYVGPLSKLPKECYGVPGVATPKAVEAQTAAPAPLAAATASPLTTLPPSTPLPQTISGISKVHLQVVWRAFCPACKWYLNDPLLRVLQDPEFTEILSFEPYPSGASQGRQGVYNCAAGESECIGHRYMSCVIHLYPNIAQQAKYLACIEDEKPTGRWDKIMGMCFKGDELAKLKSCFATDSANLFDKFIEKTDNVDTPWLPHTTVDGTILGSATRGVGYDELTKAICHAYKGPIAIRPKVCPQLATEMATAYLPKATVIQKAATLAPTTPIQRNIMEDEIEEDNQPVRPCVNREKGFVYKDAPDIGKRGLRKEKEEQELVKMTAPPSALVTNSLLVPVLILVVILFIVYQFTQKSDKKQE
ncbi:hypothetical protein THRCLA_11414, partial [Thraustotheca clavata]